MARWVVRSLEPTAARSPDLSDEDVAALRSFLAEPESQQPEPERPDPPPWPTGRWWDGWLWPGAPTLTLVEIDLRWPGALVAFDWACSDLSGGALPVRFVDSQSDRPGGKLAVSVPLALMLDWPSKSREPVRHGVRHAWWKADVGVWIRYSTGLPSRPRRPPRSF